MGSCLDSASSRGTGTGKTVGANFFRAMSSARIGVEPKTLEDYLEQMSIHFHKGSNGDIWVSIKTGADDSPSRVDFFGWSFS